MVDEWDWFWASEHGRDRILRDELENASASAARAHSTMRGLRSQLTELQGDVGLRLRRLSRAFDAYVELGDIREQLLDHGDTRLIRRDAARAVEALAAGAVPPPLDADDYVADYWLVEAINAVIAIAAGRRDPALEQQVVTAEPRGELFLLACAAALGHGSAVADRLPSALAGDGTLDPDRRVLAEAVLEGRFGPAGDRHLDGVVAEALGRVDWSRWCRERAGGDDPGHRLAELERFWQGSEPAGPEQPARLRVGRWR
uniref:hypothetical protein n=1 Tax=Desertihabitans aurantiacus TaxID=2282477 RepID=UPI0018E573EB